MKCWVALGRVRSHVVGLRGCVFTLLIFLRWRLYEVVVLWEGFLPEAPTVVVVHEGGREAAGVNVEGGDKYRCV